MVPLLKFCDLFSSSLVQVSSKITFMEYINSCTYFYLHFFSCPDKSLDSAMLICTATVEAVFERDSTIQQHTTNLLAQQAEVTSL